MLGQRGHISTHKEVAETEQIQFNKYYLLPREILFRAGIKRRIRFSSIILDNYLTFLQFLHLNI